MTSHPMHNGSGLIRAFRAAKCSAQGLQAAWKNESAFRQEVILAIIFIPLGFWLGQSLIEKLFLVSTVIGVLTIEIINSAIEATVDRIGDEFHELAGRAKDMGSAAVFMTLIFTGFSYLAIAVNRFIL